MQPSKSPLLRRMKLALAEAEEQSANQNTENSSYHSTVQFSALNSVNQNSVAGDSTNQNSWQNSTRKGTVKADEDFEFKGFPKPPPHFFPPPPTLTTQTVPIPVNRLPGQQDSPPKVANIDFQDHPTVEIKRIPLIFKGIFSIHPRISAISPTQIFKNDFSTITKKPRL